MENGEIPLSVLSWRELTMVGITDDAASTLAALLLPTLDAPAPPSVAFHFAPVPWKLFLFASVWRRRAPPARRRLRPAVGRRSMARPGAPRLKRRAGAGRRRIPRRSQGRPLPSSARGAPRRDHVAQEKCGPRAD
jgi:hypothetical protein